MFLVIVEKYIIFTKADKGVSARQCDCIVLLKPMELLSPYNVQHFCDLYVSYSLMNTTAADSLQAETQLNVNIGTIYRKIIALKFTDPSTHFAQLSQSQSGFVNVLN